MEAKRTEGQATPAGFDFAASLEAMQARTKARYAERKQVEHLSFGIRYQLAKDAEGQPDKSLPGVIYEALQDAECVIAQVDQAIDSLERLRSELIAIALNERLVQVDRVPDVDEIARNLGEVACLLRVREMLTKKAEGR